MGRMLPKEPGLYRGENLLCGIGEIERVWDWDWAMSEPVEDVARKIVELSRNGAEAPDLLVLPGEDFELLRIHPDVLRRVEPNVREGWSAMPSYANEHHLAAIWNLKRVEVVE